MQFPTDSDIPYDPTKAIPKLDGSNFLGDPFNPFSGMYDPDIDVQKDPEDRFQFDQEQLNRNMEDGREYTWTKESTDSQFNHHGKQIKKLKRVRVSKRQKEINVIQVVLQKEQEKNEKLRKELDIVLEKINDDERRF